MENLRDLPINNKDGHEHGAGDLEMANTQHEQNGQREPGDTCRICLMEQNPTKELEVSNSKNQLVPEDRIALFKAALKGDWEAAKTILERDDINVNFIVTAGSQTSLHVAAGAKRTDFVKKLVNLRRADPRLRDDKGNTAFCYAVMAGSIPVAEFLLDKDSGLEFLRDGQKSIPLFVAVIFGHHDMARLLFRKIALIPSEHLELKHREEISAIFFSCIENDMFDIALELVSRNDYLAVARNTDRETALHLLARKPLAFDSKRSGVVKMLSNLCNCKKSKDNIVLELVKKLWTKFLVKYTRDDAARDEISVPYKLLFKAAELGNYKFLAVLIQLWPELIWEIDEQNRTIFHIAAIHRQANVFNQIDIIGSIKDVLVTYQIPYGSSNSDNILHLTAKMPSPHERNSVSGSALQMQHELLWFEEVKSMLQPCDREKMGSAGLTPRQLFSKEHEALLGKAEKWMRDTAKSCLIVATIITTMVYFAGFCISSGFNDSTLGGNATKGSSININHKIFHVFVVSEAVALSFSVISMLIFLFILTSRYAEENFLKSLPLSLMCGLATLLVSITAVIVSFSSTFFLAYMEKYNQNELRWVPILVSALALLLAYCFCFLQYPLLRYIFNSTCCRSLFRPKEPLFI